MKIYIAICYDRHCDDEISAFVKLADAKAECRNFMYSYGRKYGQWEEKKDLTAKGWEYLLEFPEIDELPCAYVRSVELEQMK